MGLALTPSHEAVLAAIMARLGDQARAEYFFQAWVGETKQTQLMAQANELPGNVKGKIITTIDADELFAAGAQKGGGREIVRYITKALTGQGVSGDAQVSGTGGLQNLLRHNMFINRKRYELITEVGKMNSQLLGKWAIETAKENAPALLDWMKRWESWYGIATAFWLKFSQHIIGSADGEFAQNYHHHPNMYCVGLPEGVGDQFTFATWSATNTTYESALAKNIMGVTRDIGVITATALRKIKLAARKRRVRPLNVGGIQYVVGVHPDQWEDLMLDSEFRDTMQSWGDKAKDQSGIYFGHNAAMYDGMLIVEAFNGPCEVYATDISSGLDNVATLPENATRVFYGPLETILATPFVQVKDVTDPSNMVGDASSEPIITRDFRSHRAGILFGEGALACIKKGKENLFFRGDDYDNVKAMCVDFMRAYARPDHYDGTLATPTSVENTSSLPFITINA